MSILISKDIDYTEPLQQRNTLLVVRMHMDSKYSLCSVLISRREGEKKMNCRCFQLESIKYERKKYVVVLTNIRI